MADDLSSGEEIDSDALAATVIRPSSIAGRIRSGESGGMTLAKPGGGERRGEDDIVEGREEGGRGRRYVDKARRKEELMTDYVGVFGIVPPGIPLSRVIDNDLGANHRDFTGLAFAPPIDQIP